MGKEENSLHFLLMDENEEARKLVEEVLSDAGNVVITHAKNPDEARGLVSEGRSFDVVFASHNYGLGHELGLTVIEEFANMEEDRPYIAYYDPDASPDLQSGLESAARSSGANEVLFDLNVDRIGGIPNRVTIWREHAGNAGEGI